MRVSFKQSLFVGSSVAIFAFTQGLAFGQDQQKANETVIVTGTRVQGMTAADSAAPITVLGNDALTRGTGSADLRQQLGQSVPAFTSQQIGFELEPGCGERLELGMKRYQHQPRLDWPW